LFSIFLLFFFNTFSLEKLFLLQIRIRKSVKPEQRLKKVRRKLIGRMQEEWSLKSQPYDEWVDYINPINIYLLWNILMILC